MILGLALSPNPMGGPPTYPMSYTRVIRSIRMSDNAESVDDRCDAVTDERYVVDATNLCRAQCYSQMHFWHDRAEQMTDPDERRRMFACAEGWKKAAENVD